MKSYDSDGILLELIDLEFFDIDLPSVDRDNFRSPEKRKRSYEEHSTSSKRKKKIVVDSKDLITDQVGNLAQQHPPRAPHTF